MPLGDHDLAARRAHRRSSPTIGASRMLALPAASTTLAGADLALRPSSAGTRRRSCVMASTAMAPAGRSTPRALMRGVQGAEQCAAN